MIIEYHDGTTFSRACWENWGSCRVQQNSSCCITTTVTSAPKTSQTGFIWYKRVLFYIFSETKKRNTLVYKYYSFTSLHLPWSLKIMTESLSLELAARPEALVWTETVVLAVINVVALFGNVLTCYAVYRNQSLRTLPNMFVVALGVSDILMSTCCMPFSVATLFHGQWLFGESFWRFHGFGVLTFGLVSLQTMGIIAVSRYFCVVKPEKYIVVFKKQRTLMYIAVVWCVLDLCRHSSSRPEGLNSNLVKQSVCTLLKVTFLIQSLLCAFMSQPP